ncbi:MAG: aspartate/glutamate racemase family protein [Candidatus Korobacteraceae bacterium]|jgi:aspartate racemase
MRTVGILGGIGPESTVEYYRGIVAGYRQQRPDGSYPSIFINSISVSKLLGWMDAGELGEVVDYLAEELQKLVHAGADFGIIAANTPHIVFDELQRRSPIPLISIVEATCAEAKKREIRTAGLLGTRFTMQSSFYPDVFRREGVTLVVPDEAEQAYIHEKYVGELLANTFLPETRARLLEIIQRMNEQEQIQAVILGGTELPLLLRDETAFGIPLLDTTQIHVRAVVAELLA